MKVWRVGGSLLGPVDVSFRALSGRLEFTARRHQFNDDAFSGARVYAKGWMTYFQVQQAFSLCGRFDLVDEILSIMRDALVVTPWSGGWQVRSDRRDPVDPALRYDRRDRSWNHRVCIHRQNWSTILDNHLLKYPHEGPCQV